MVGDILCSDSTAIMQIAFNVLIGDLKHDSIRHHHSIQDVGDEGLLEAGRGCRTELAEDRAIQVIIGISFDRKHKSNSAVQLDKVMAK